MLKSRRCLQVRLAISLSRKWICSLKSSWTSTICLETSTGTMRTMCNARFWPSLRWFPRIRNIRMPCGIPMSRKLGPKVKERCNRLSSQSWRITWSSSSSSKTIRHLRSGFQIWYSTSPTIRRARNM